MEDNVKASSPRDGEPTAIIGIGCRFPGGILCPESFWQALCEGRDGITEVPSTRWDLGAYHDPDVERSGKVYTRKGGFLEDIDLFDPQFFGISPREAPFLDPQQRLLLETTWEALEDGGMDPHRLAGAKVGVFVGLFMHDYENMHCGVSERELFGPHSATGMSTTIAANRISYVYDFRGPSVVVDTACSSSLVAVHLACQSIRTCESRIAVAGGVNLLIRPEMTMVLCRGSFLSPDGYCKSFDARADGYTRAEGVGMVVLKRLSEALADGDPIYAVIRGSAVNQDGRSEGLTVPSFDAQAALIREALGAAGLSPKEVQYVEAHGTGTRVGDPIEAWALGEVLAGGRPEGSQCVVGSVKSNFGHTESAAGIAALIKSTLALQHGRIPPNLHFETPSPEIPFEDLKLRVPTALEPWPGNGEGPRIAGVNSFGFGGTNAHVILQSVERAEEGMPTAPPQTRSAGSADGAALVPLSAHTPEALEALAESYLGFLTSAAREPGVGLSDIAHSASLRRGQHPHRLSIVARSEEELGERLEAHLAGEKRPGMSVGHAGHKSPPKMAFVFSGMGQQWWAMGRELIKTQAVFREALEECDGLFRAHTDEWSLLGELGRDEESSRVNETHIAQPSIFSVQVALTRLWHSWGVVPGSIVGHSVGELAAVHVSGVLSLEDAVRACYHRSRLQRTRAGHGKMLAVGLPLADAEGILELYPEKVSVAAINSPDSLALSGDAEALEEIASVLEEQKIFARFLRVEVPYHSPAMEPILNELEESLAGVQPCPDTIPLISTVTGKRIEWGEATAAYWPRNVRQPVRFMDAINELIRTGHRTFIEIGAHPVLATSILECLSQAGEEGTTLASLKRKEPEEVVMLGALGQLYTIGYPVDWSRQNHHGGRFVRLPSYPWQRERYWVESDESQQARGGQLVRQGQTLADGESHPLLGSRLQAPAATWSAEVDLRDLPYLADHMVQGSIVYPAAAYLEMGLAAAKSILEEDEYALRDLEIKAPLLLSETGSEVQLVVEQNERFAIYSRPGNPKQPWSLHASGEIEPVEEGTPSRVAIEEIRQRCAQEVPGSECYELFRARSLEYGPAFQGIGRVWTGDGEALARLQLNAEVGSEPEVYVLHPAILDSCFQVLASIPTKGTYLPVGAGRLRVHGRMGATGWCHARLLEHSASRLRGDIRLLDDAGVLLAEVRNFRCQRIEGGDAPPESIDGHLYQYQWKSQPRPDETSRLVGAASAPCLEETVARLRPVAAQLAKQHAREDYYAVVEPKVETLCRHFVVQALRELGWGFDEPGAFGAHELAERLGVVADQRRLFGRLLEILAEDGILARAEEQWKVARPPGTVEPEQVWYELLLQHPSSLAELTLIQRCGARLKEVLRGDDDPLSIIFPQGSLLTEHLYQASPTFRMYNRLVQQAVSSIVGRLPEGQTLRVLEIGGGTGSMTSYVLPALPASRTHYVFTDISQAFLTQVEAKFRDYRFVEYRTLNIERDPLEQGFEPHSFDLVLASDVLHATPDLRAVLGSVKHVLASDGMLVLIEATRRTRWFDLVFGMLPGWWLFSDSDLRPSHALLPQQGWLDLLSTNAFPEVAAVSDRGEELEPTHSIILARGPSVPRDAPEPEPKETSHATGDPGPDGDRPWVIFADDDGLTERLAGLLRTEQVSPILVSRGEAFENLGPGHWTIRPGHADDLRQLLDATSPAPAASPVLVYLWGTARPDGNLTAASLEQMANEDCAQVLQTVQALMARDWASPPRLWLVSNGTQTIGNIRELSLEQTPLWGLGRVIVSEHANLETRMIDLSPSPSDGELASLCRELLLSGGEDEVTLRGEERYIHRLIREERTDLSTPPEVPFRASKVKARDDETFAFQEVERSRPGPGEVEVQVHAAGVNFKDVAKVTGLLDQTSAAETGLLDNLGLECSGVVVEVGEGVDDFRVGDEVLGLALNCFGNYVTTVPQGLAHKPSDLSFEEAATVPLAFLASSYALHELARLREGERVLIHTATGGVGLAAIQLAKEAGAEIFATAGSPEKRAYLQAMGIQYVGDSRTLAFADEILAATGNEGVDVVLNTLPAKTVGKSLSALKPVTGRFVDLSNVYERSLALDSPDRGLSFFSFDFERLVHGHRGLVRSLLQKVIRRLDEGELRPLPHRTFPISELGNAVRYLRRAKHIGKVMVSMQEPGVVSVPTRERIDVRADGTYLITGGLGGFGSAVARWLVDCGARHLVLMSRSGASSPAAAEVVRELEGQGATVHVAQADVCQERQVREALAQVAETMPALRGVVHAAMVLDDSPLMEMTAHQMKRVMDPKMLGAWNLHRHTLDRPLDFFICFSSFTSLIGNADQGNYAAGNLFLDSLAHHRRARGLPALTVCWGAIAEVGYVAERENIREFIRRQGINELPLNLAWRAIRYGLEQDLIQVGVAPADWRRMARYSVAVARSPRFSGLVETSPEADEEAREERAKLTLSGSPEERRGALTAVLRSEVAGVLGVSSAKLDMAQPLDAMGLDSLMAVELVTRIEDSTDINMPKMAVLEPGLTAEGLVSVVEKELPSSGMVLPEPAGMPGADAPGKVDAGPDERDSGVSEGSSPAPTEVDDLSDEEVTSMLSSMLSEEEGQDE